MSMICKCDRCDTIIKDKRKDGMALRVYDSVDIIAGSAVELIDFLNEYPKVLSVTNTETGEEEDNEKR